ncbi:MAG: tetratricopeptide repeat protein [Cyclobacteriaceae bacterium]|nr:MAG: tetratricopeptide repeat protein [Cyclobacteriaceae bacterium]
MPSIIPDFEYDIFISYRHNDNKGGWVTDFVKSLREELAATIKDKVSVYFDTNAYDGLLDTHNVDKSLERKLKSLIFIPVLSQTYADTKSFAWNNEFCAYNKLLQTDSLGKDIHLINGNVTSRILPIRIHDLETEDKVLIETELGAVLRAIDFIYREPGVNRPLTESDKREQNLAKTFYRDQVNKVAYAVKAILQAIRNPHKEMPAEYSIAIQKNEHTHAEVSDKSVAVLPFANLSHDPGQEYFADGITENILMHLSALPQFRVISRTSVMRYKKTTKSAPEIGAELGVKYIIEGSAQARKDKVRINVQLIDAQKDQPVWTRMFTESLEDIFEIENTVAEVVSEQLKVSLSPEQKENLNALPTRNMEAYDQFLKGRHAFNQWNVAGYKLATEHFKKAIELDPDFKEAYSYLASSYSARMSWNGDLSPVQAKPEITRYLHEALQRGPTDNDYLTKAFVSFFIDKNFTEAERSLLQAIALNANNALALYTYSYVLNMMGRFDEATTWVEAAQKIEPGSIACYNYRALSLYLRGFYREAITVLNEGLKLFPGVLRFYDLLGRIHLTTGKFKEAAEVLEKGLTTSEVRPPSMLAYLAVALSNLNETAKAQKLFDELLSRSANQEKGVNIYLVHACLGSGETENARAWHEKSRQTNDVDLIWWQVDPLLASMRQQTSGPIKDNFERAEEFVLQLLHDKMPAHAYHNLAHVLDVQQAVQTIAEAEQVSSDELKVLRLAALLHDIGFIKSPKDHEVTGAEMAKEILPKFNIDATTVEYIAGMILATKLPQSPTTKLETILCDADLDYLGRNDFFEIGGRLYEELKAAGAVETEREWNLVQRTFLQSHKYHTAFSRTHRESEKQKHLLAIQQKLNTR